MSIEKFSQEELEEHKQCEETYAAREQLDKTRIVQCPNATAYRVKRWGERKYLKEGGDPSEAADYEFEQTEATDYVCREHFERKYLYAEFQVFAGECPSEYMKDYAYGRYMGKWTFRRFK